MRSSCTEVRSVLVMSKTTYRSCKPSCLDGIQVGMIDNEEHQVERSTNEFYTSFRLTHCHRTSTMLGTAMLQLDIRIRGGNTWNFVGRDVLATMSERPS